eukprot:jgi/Botrbrau1/5392/Bobra.0346s0052.1
MSAGPSPSKLLEWVLSKGQQRLRTFEANVQTVVEIIFPGPLGALGMQDGKVRYEAKQAVKRALQSPVQTPRS